LLRFDRVDLVSAQSGRDFVLLRVDAVDASPLSVRPVDGVRVEGAAAGLGAESDRHGGRSAGVRPMTLFYLFGAAAVIASLLVIAQRNPMYSVLLLIASFGALSGLYVLLDAPFVAVIQIIIYAGAIMVLFLFVVMLLNAPHEETEFDARVHPVLRTAAMRLGAVLAIALVVELMWALTRLNGSGSFPSGAGGWVAAVG